MDEDHWFGYDKVLHRLPAVEEKEEKLEMEVIPMRKELWHQILALTQRVITLEAKVDKLLVEREPHPLTDGEIEAFKRSHQDLFVGPGIPESK